LISKHSISAYGIHELLKTLSQINEIPLVDGTKIIHHLFISDGFAK
jgi:hypothetical protein